jgi:hypothetical protein
MVEELPVSVRYVKNGAKGLWWAAAKKRGQVHLGWKDVPAALLRKPDYGQIEGIIRTVFGEKRGATQDFNALCDALKCPSQYIWMTFEDGFMWWCTVRDGAIPNPAQESRSEGHFWLECDRPWSNCSLNGRLLTFAELPGTVTKTAGFKATVCEPDAWQTALRIIRDEKDPDAEIASDARAKYEQAVSQMVKRLSPKDFEQVVDLILARSGWVRISTLGGPREGVEADVENPAAAEVAFVQVKSSAGQDVLDDYIRRFQKRRDRYARMIFAVHTPHGRLEVPRNHTSIQIWDGGKIANLIVRLGLGEWVESRLGL